MLPAATGASGARRHAGSRPCTWLHSPLEDPCWRSVENRSRKECHGIRLAHGIEATIRASRGRLELTPGRVPRPVVNLAEEHGSKALAVGSLMRIDNWQPTRVWANACSFSSDLAVSKAGRQVSRHRSLGSRTPVTCVQPLEGGSASCAHLEAAEYRAPELWCGGAVPSEMIHRVADVWAYGCSIWQVATGRVFFQAGGSYPQEGVGGIIDSYCASYRGGVTSTKFRPWLARIEFCGKWQSLAQACLNPCRSRRPINIIDVVGLARTDTAS